MKSNMLHIPLEKVPNIDISTARAEPSQFLSDIREEYKNIERGSMEGVHALGVLLNVVSASFYYITLYPKNKETQIKKVASKLTSLYLKKKREMYKTGYSSQKIKDIWNSLEAQYADTILSNLPDGRKN